MKTLPYQHVLQRVRAELLDMPGMQLTPEQMERLSGVESATCKAVLDDLVRAGFLGISANGSYGRSPDFQMRGGDHGRDQEDWFEAEPELNQDPQE